MQLDISTEDLFEIKKPNFLVTSRQLILKFCSALKDILVSASFKRISRDWGKSQVLLYMTVPRLSWTILSDLNRLESFFSNSQNNFSYQQERTDGMLDIKSFPNLFGTIPFSALRIRSPSHLGMTWKTIS